MTIRTQRRLYWIAAAALAAATAVWWFNFAAPITPENQPPRLSIEEVTSTALPSTAASGTFDPLPSLSDFRPYWDRPLRTPLYDPPPPPAPVAPPPPPLRLRLLGTVVEADRSEAILITASGNMEMHRVGATVDNATIQSIGDGTIDVLYHDQTLTLTPAPGR